MWGSAALCHIICMEHSEYLLHHVDNWNGISSVFSFVNTSQFEEELIWFNFWFFQRKFQSNDAENFVVYAIPTYQMLWAFGLIYLSCELAQMVTNGFADICDVIDNFDWYLLPYKQRRMLTIILMNAHQPVYLECFGSFSCNRNSLKKVNRNNFKQIINSLSSSINKSTLFEFSISI